MTAVACGIDWAEGHHDIAIVDQDGAVILAERIGNDVDGLGRLLSILKEHDSGDEPLPIAIETSRGLLVAGLRAAGRTVYAINPFAVSRYRDRYRSSGAKSDAFDAMVLGNILRTDRPAHRPLPTDTEAIQALRVLTRTQQDAVWERTEVVNRIRSLLKAYYPSALAAFERGGKHQLHSPAARRILAAAPTPTAAARLTKPTLAAHLRRAGRTRGIDAEAATLQQHLRQPALHQPAAIENAHSLQLWGLIRQLDAICVTLGELETAMEAAFTAHPDAAIVTSFPGLGTQLGARILAEIGDDRTRFADARALRAFAGAAPVTRASGRTRNVYARRAKNDRIAAAGYVWAMAAIRHDPQWESKYRTRRAHGDRHVTALRKLFNTMLSKLHHCLTTRQQYRTDLAFATAETAAA